MRRLFTAGLWLATTAAATALVWTATSVVASDVTDRPAPVVAHRDVVIALASGSTPVATTVAPASTSTAPGVTNTRPGPPKVSATPPTVPLAPPTTRHGPVLPPPQSSPVPAATNPTPIAPTLPRPLIPPTTSAPPIHATYSTTGGVVTVECTGPSTIRLVSASPSDGYRLDFTRVNLGPSQVEVHFLDRSDDIAVNAMCFFGWPIRLDDHSRPAGTD